MRRCLFVDDSSVILKVASRILSGPDMLVATAESARQALDMCARDMPDIIVLDADLPDMAPAEFVRRLPAFRSAISPRILMCMVGFDVADYMRARRAGVHGYLQKPFNRSQLLDAFRSLENATAA